MSIWSSVISGLFGIGQQAWQNAYNSKEAEKNRVFQSAEADENRTFQSEEAEKARVFNSNEAALQREWSAAEAEQARDWQEEMYAKYNSLSGKISQAEQAGVNPMLAITGNAVSPMSATSSAPSGVSAPGSPSPSGAMASGSAASNGMLNILGAILDGAKLKSEIDLNKSQANKNNADAEQSKWLARLSEREYKIITENNFDIQEIENRIHLSSIQATEVYHLALKHIEDAGKIAEERQFLSDTSDDREKIVEYEKAIAEFEASLSNTIESLEDGQKKDLSDWVGAIIKILLGIKK